MASESKVNQAASAVTGTGKKLAGWVGEQMTTKLSRTVFLAASCIWLGNIIVAAKAGAALLPAATDPIVGGLKGAWNGAGTIVTTGTKAVSAVDWTSVWNTVSNGASAATTAPPLAPPLVTGTPASSVAPLLQPGSVSP